MDPAKPIIIDPDHFLKDHCSLPALPKLVTQIQEIMHSDNMHVDETSKLISSDPSLVAQILKVVNSAYFSLPKEIADVKFAIAFLGLNEVYRIVLSISAVNALDVKAKKELSAFWAHSFFSALCAKYLAKKYNSHLDQGELWSATILHDIGKLVYLKFFPDQYITLKKFCKKTGCLFSEAEKRYGLPSSAYFGTLLCEHWRLPRKIKEACGMHSLDDLKSIDKNIPATAFIQMICISNLLAVLANEVLNKETKEELSNTIKHSAGYSNAEFLIIMGDIYELKDEINKFL